VFRIIIVEDEPRILRYLKDKITSLSTDFKVVGLYNNGEDALIELHWTQPHVLITDIRMPVMNGLELITRVKEKLPDIQCAIVSGHDDYMYLREAIQLGISDYILKPAPDEEMAELLARLKEKLLVNQALLEREAAKRIVDASASAFSSANASSPEESEASGAKWTELTHELFYHGNYVLAYAWSPHGNIPEALLADMGGLLREGEKISPLPSLAANEEIVLFGIHSWSEDRKLEWQERMEARLGEMEGVTVLLEQSTRGLQPIPALLAECRKLAPAVSRFRSYCLWTSEAGAEEIPSLYETMQPLLARMSQFANKQQKQSFMRELELLFAGEAGRRVPLTRRGWEKLLLYVSLSLHGSTQISPGSSFEGKQAMEAELVDEVWRARSLVELQQQAKEIWGAYFFRSEQEREQAAQRDWAEEARKYLHAHYHENISLPGIADAFQLHPAYLNRVFKRACGTSIPDYLLNLRMEEASRLIKEHPFVLIKEIAERVGYSDPFYFSKVFKQHTGFSPSDYKNSKG
jgi:Response regulator containing CheY-like receiver domain and AraC-type DNA-binding domain